MFPVTTKPGGVHTTAGPLDVCMTPAPPGGGPIPIPYANMVDGLAASGDKAAERTKKKILDDAARKGYKAGSATSAAIFSRGDEAGTLKGMVSHKNMDAARYRAGASKVKLEGGRFRRFDSVPRNAPMGTRIAPSQTKVVIMGGGDDEDD